MNRRRLLLCALLAAGSGCSRAARAPKALADAGAGGHAAPIAKGPERREVDDLDGDGKKEEVEIETYGGKPGSLARWTEEYGITSRKIAVIFPGGEPRFRDADSGAWRTAYDWDGDGEKDRVESRFSGGAHCCYRVGVSLSSKKEKTTWVPFEMDGGYVYPEDLPDNPRQFSVGRTPDGLPEMRMLIATYNGERLSLPRSWRARYRIRSHYVGISFPNGNVRVRDLPPE
jgi:hypothetical protein